jgi:hypothetical protein
VYGIIISVVFIVARFITILKGIKRNFFLKKHYPLASTMELLKELYPNVDWRRVDFYEGLPWFTPLVAPYVTAQALPRFYSFSGYRIYLKAFDETRAQCLADIVHEGFHIMQAMQFWKGYGLGFLRGLMVYYNALFFTHGYRSNPFEVPAYDQEFRFLDHCRQLSYHGLIPKLPQHPFGSIPKSSGLIFTHSPFKYKGSRLVLIGSFLVCLLIALIKPIADILVFVLGNLVSLFRSSTTD